MQMLHPHLPHDRLLRIIWGGGTEPSLLTRTLTLLPRPAAVIGARRAESCGLSAAGHAPAAAPVRGLCAAAAWGPHPSGSRLWHRHPPAAPAVRAWHGAVPGPTLSGARVHRRDGAAVRELPYVSSMSLAAETKPLQWNRTAVCPVPRMVCPRRLWPARRRRCRSGTWPGSGAWTRSLHRPPR